MIQVIRKLVETQNQDKVTAAWEWLPNEWSKWRHPIDEMQSTLVKLGACRILLRLLALHEEPIVRFEAIQALCAMLLGGQREVQDDVLQAMLSPLGNGTLGVFVCKAFEAVCDQAKVTLRRSMRQSTVKIKDKVHNSPQTYLSFCISQSLAPRFVTIDALISPRTGCR